ncbi:ATP-binding protein [Ktedonobacter racemifer]|uniref:Adenylate/guanylate cyclase n=1 Tax=Ktedonobacter racemifer DSM 44963 TaxID=485913 RepID=D6TLV9_KTERA|nr:adenylate/guanylate cyclase domain-containing protein [Ktedonobacter racemifer]EFH86759.1 adenylate/guanylate cyclase [Ktedonobacter racemifer DSM 44963]
MPEERKLVSILFADVTGSTALGDELDPEDVRALMGRYYEHARQIIPQHGGTLEKFIGDAVMAIFGLPQAHGDDPERALAAALALRKAVADDEMLGSIFQLRIGVNTGEVMATSDSTSNQFMATGDAVNVAARLEQNANPGEILAGERTYAAASHAFLFDASRHAEVKGKSRPLTVYPLQGPRATRKVERPPLVGRKQDLMQLALLQARALEEERPQLVSITAPAGTGKTRLLEEFLARLDLDENFQVATARCLPYGQTLTYWPLRGLLSQLIQGGDITITRPNVAHVFREASYAQADAERLADLILATLGIEGETTTDRENIFSAWRLLIEVLATQAPRIVIFEDLHWASDSLFDLVEYITHLRTQAPLMLIALSRPELLDRRPNWGGGRQNFTSLALQPLSPRNTQELISHLMQDVPQAVRTQIVERSGGNPFFALELLRGLQERGLTGDTASIEQLPDTVHAAVQARLDQLSRPERSVLQVASVAGRALSLTMLAEVLSEYSLSELQQALDGLLERDILVPSEGHTYAFLHILFRDVAYGTLARTQRVRLHEKIATSLETLNADHLDEYAELIAYHYREAVTLSRQAAIRTQLQLDVSKALHFLRRAAHLASHAGAYFEAQNYLQSAIAIAPESELIAIYEELGDCMFWSRTTAEAYQQAFAYWEKQNTEHTPDASQSLVGARLLRKLLINYTRGGGWERIEGTEQQIPVLLERAQTLVAASGNEYEQWRIHLVRCFSRSHIVESSKEELQQILPVAQEATTYFEQQNDPQALSEALDAQTTLFMRLRDYPAMLEVNQRRRAIPHLSAAELGDALHMLVFSYGYMKNYEASFELVLQELKSLRPGQSLLHLSAALSSIAPVAFGTGHWDLLEILYPKMEEIREQNSSDLSTFNMFDGYFSLLRWALAHENRPTIDSIAAFLRRVVGEIFALREQFTNVIEIYQTDDIGASSLKLTDYQGGMARIILLFCLERNLPFPEELIPNTQTDLFGSGNSFKQDIEIAYAILTDDNERFARALEKLEQYQEVVHAARLDIVLAERTGDRRYLGMARPILERLQDRQFLRRLNDVAERLTS